MKAITEPHAEEEHLVYDILLHIGENPDREGLLDTPERVVRMWKEIFKGYGNPPKITVFNNGSDGITYNQMIFDTGIFYSHCEHHMVPFFGNYYFAFLPNEKGQLIGLSKVARVVDHFSSKLQIQERLTHQIVDYIWTTLCFNDEGRKCKYPPKGMALVMEAEHLCKTMRGVKKKGKMRTAYLKGVIKNDDKARQEFLDWVNTQ